MPYWAVQRPRQRTKRCLCVRVVQERSSAGERASEPRACDRRLRCLTVVNCAAAIFWASSPSRVQMNRWLLSCEESNCVFRARRLTYAYVLLHMWLVLHIFCLVTRAFPRLFLPEQTELSCLCVFVCVCKSLILLRGLIGFVAIYRRGKQVMAHIQAYDCAVNCSSTSRRSHCWPGSKPPSCNLHA